MLSPDHHIALAGLARVLRRVGQTERAEELFKRFTEDIWYHTHSDVNFSLPRQVSVNKGRSWDISLTGWSLLQHREDSCG